MIARTLPKGIVVGVFPLVLAACPSRVGKLADDQGTASGRAPAAGAEAHATPSEHAQGPKLSRDEICARTPTAHAAALSGAAPFTEDAPHCNPDDPFCDTVDKAPNPKNACFVANDNIARAEREARSVATTVAPASTPWDGATPPKYLDRIDAHLHLTREEHDKLKKNKFVVLDRFAYTSYAAAFHDVFQEQLPLFVGVDPILHAVFRGTELSLERVERKRLIPALMTMLKKLRGTFAATAGALDATTRSDLDVYLGVAAALAPQPAAPRSFVGSSSSSIPPEPPKPKLSLLRGTESAKNDAVIRDLVESCRNDRTLKAVTIFGRERMVDFSQLEPRGHYVTNYMSGETGPAIEDYFRSMMWLSRLELNLVSRSSKSSHPTIDPSETPREVKAAIALAELVERSGASSELRLFDEIYTAYAGRREDVSPAKLLEIAQANGIRASEPDPTPKLKTAIGEGFVRTARTHFTPENAPKLPVIFTLIGPRIVPDVAPLTRVVHDAIPDRTRLGAADVGYILGHDRAATHIRDFASQPGLPEAFKRARAELDANAALSHDVYGSWLRSILALRDLPTGVVPSFVKTDAYADHRLSSALVGFGQLRHTFVLLAAQGYDAYGCEIPDAYVEPLPTVFEALGAHVRNMRASASTKGWSGLERVIAMLAKVARDETSGRLLSEPERRWLAMVSEHIPNGGYVSSGEPPKWTGWYFDMFEDREHGASKSTSFIADYFTLTNAGEVAYLGAEGPRLGVFIVDTNGAPRAMVGPVAKGFEAHAPIDGRLNDENVFDDGTKKSAAWRATYAVPERPEPLLGLEGEVVRCGDVATARSDMDMMPAPLPVPRPATAAPKKPDTPKKPEKVEWRVAVRSKRAAGKTSVTLLDHHGDALTSPLVFDLAAGSEWQIGVFEMPEALAKSRFGVEALHVRVDDLAPSRTGTGPYDYSTSPSVYTTNGPNGDADKMPVRPTGPGYFSIGVPPPPKKTPPAPVPK